MPENTPYFENIVAQRALLLDPEDYQGEHTISMETQADIVCQSTVTYIQEHFDNFMEYLRYLSEEDQELLLSYYLLGKTQWSIARLHGSTQTICSFKLRLAMKRLGLYIILGNPTSEKINQILKSINQHKYSNRVLYSDLIEAYANTRSFKAVAAQFGLARPEVHRALSSLSKQLLKSKETAIIALGAYVFGLIDKASAQGKGLSNRERAKICPIYRKDAAIVGAFSKDVGLPEFEQCLVSKANN